MSLARATLLLLAIATNAVAQSVVTPWTPKGISSAMFESHPAFDPRTEDFYFVRSSRSFEGWRMFVSTCTAAGWSEPRPPEFAGDGLEADPWFTPDGRSLYFISSRTTDGIVRKDLDIWRVDRDLSGKWGTPVRLPEPVNSTAAEWFPRVAPDGDLYFGSARPGGFGRNDIWRARLAADGSWQVANGGATINSTNDEYEPLISPDGAMLLVDAHDGLYESHLARTGWSQKVKLPAAVNLNGTEVGALFSPSGRSVLFARDTKGPLSGEFFVWHRKGAEDWPPPCAAKPSGPKVGQ